jgi:hypothetical protein
MARIEYGRSRSGQIVRVGDARRDQRYTCPVCGLLLELRRGEQLEYFAHWRNLPGTKDCELFSLGDGSHGADGPSQKVLSESEENPCDLSLQLALVDDRWGLGLCLPEIPSDELGEQSLDILRSAFVEVYVGSDCLLKVSALDLRPGVGAAHVEVIPTLQTYRTQPAGLWPTLIDNERWCLESQKLEVKGSFFRLRRGEWMRLLTGSSVHHGETLLVLADKRSVAPPDSIVLEVHEWFSGGLHWVIRKVQLPNEPVASVSSWLAQLSHELVARPWSVSLVTPPRSFNERGQPLFWVGDSPILVLEAPHQDAIGMVTFQGGANYQSASVRVTQGRFAHASVSVSDVGPTRITVLGGRSAGLDLLFVERPLASRLSDLLVRLPRLCIRIGKLEFEAWQGASHMVLVTSRDIPEVFVELGDENARARVTVWQRGKQRSWHGLDSRRVAQIIEDVLAIADRVEVDAENLGRVMLFPARAKLRATHKEKVSDRLAWRDRVLRICSRTNKFPSSTPIKQPRTAESLAARKVSLVALVRSRIVLR